MRGDVAEIHCGPDVLLLARFGALSRLPYSERSSQPAIGLLRRMACDREAVRQLRLYWSRCSSDSMTSRLSDEQLLLAVTHGLETGALHGVALPSARLTQSFARKPKGRMRPAAAVATQKPGTIFTPRPLVTTAAVVAAQAAAAPKPVSQWTLEERISAVVNKTIPRVPGQFGDALLDLISPENLAVMAVCIGISVAANLTPAGWIADAVLAGVAFYFGGMMAIQAIGDLIDAMRLTYGAQSDADLNAAADKMAKVIALIGVIGLAALLHKIAAKKGAPGTEKKGGGKGNEGTRRSASPETAKPKNGVTSAAKPRVEEQVAPKKAVNEPPAPAKIAKNSYNYALDSNGRTVRASGKLSLKKAPRDTGVQRAAGGADRLATDQGGHLIGSRFNGPNDAFNTVAQNQNLNQGSWKAMENSWARALKDGQEVFVDIKPQYVGENLRPASFKVNYTIDGIPKTVNIPNVASQ